MRYFIVTLDDEYDPDFLPDSAVEIAINSVDSVETIAIPLKEVINCYDLYFPDQCLDLYNVQSDLYKYTGEGANRKEWSELSPDLKQIFIDCVEIDEYYELGQDWTRTYSVFANKELNKHIDSYYHSLSYYQLPLGI